MKIALIFAKLVIMVVIFLPAIADCQQISPIELVMEPDKYDIFLSGTGGGDNNNLKIRSANPSAQGMVEASFWNKLSKKSRITNLPIIFRWNFIPASKLIRRDTFSARTLAFVDNNQLFNFGIRVRNVGVSGSDRLMHGPTVDVSYNNYDIEDSANAKIKFQSLNCLAGYQAAFLKKSTLGNIGFTFSANGGYIKVIDENPNAFEVALQDQRSLSRNFASAGGKVQVQLNDVAIFFELKQIFPLDNSARIPEFSDKMIISFGGNAVGSLLKGQLRKNE